MDKKPLLLLIFTMVSVIGQNQELRLLLVGKTGVGKSTTGNVILGRQQFPAKGSAKSVTKKTEKATANRFGRHLTVVDTPGFFDTIMSSNDVMVEIGKCHAMTSPGLHAILFVIEIGRITAEEENTITLFLDYFGEKVYDHVIVVFTRHKPESIDIVDFVKNEIEDTSILKSLLSHIDNRFIALGRDVTETEIKNLLKLVDSVVERNNGKYYTNEMYQAAVRRMDERKKEEKRKLQEQKDMEIERKKKEEEENHRQEMMKIQQKMKDEEIEFKFKKLKGPRYQMHCIVGSKCGGKAYFTYHYDGMNIPLCCLQEKPKMYISDERCHCRTGKDETSEIIVDGKLTL